MTQKLFSFIFTVALLCMTFSASAQVNNTINGLVKDSMHITAENAVLLTIPDSYQKGDVVLTYGENQVNGQRKIRNGIKCISFDMPAISYQKVIVKNK